MKSASQTVLYMPQLRVVGVRGNDAEQFLQAQLSSRVDDIGPALSRLAAWHDARGKVRAIFRVLRNSEGFLLVTVAEIAEPVCAAMKMYVLRADVDIGLTDQPCGGLTSPADATGLPADLPQHTNAVVGDDNGLTVCVAPGCWHVIGDAVDAATTPDPDVSPVDAAEIRAGLPQVDSRTAGQFVPHMLNLDRLGALDFEKGCYPGQEVIARTEHLGSVKRRAHAFVSTSATLPESATALVDAHGAQIGSVLRAARDTDGRIYLLAVVAIEALDEAVLLDTSDRPRLERISLPFE